MSGNVGSARLLFAGAALALYLLLVGFVVWRGRRRRRQFAQDAATFDAPAAGTHNWLGVYASQTGNAEALAWQTARALHTAGLAARTLNIANLDLATLLSSERALFIASTYGEGDPPDNATVFTRRVMAQPAVLPQLHFAVMALGDREYANFCGFGRALDEWLQAHGAAPLFARVEANNSDPHALELWRHHLSHLAGTDDLPDWDAPAFESWRLTARSQLNIGSEGAPVFHLELEPTEGRSLPAWQSGDLAQVIAPVEVERVREYTIASIPADGNLQLLVRQERRLDGTLGVCSGWLTVQLQVGAKLSLRVRAHENFRLGNNAARPLLLIGNGTGIAGLRAHLKSRAAVESRHQWLVFGERNAACDGLYREELESWRCSGVLDRLDLVYSRDQAQRRYVQHLLCDSAAEVRAWIARDAAIYVCGSLEGMAAGVEAALREILGDTAVERLSAQGRYRRDVY